MSEGSCTESEDTGREDGKAIHCFRYCALPDALHRGILRTATLDVQLRGRISQSFLMKILSRDSPTVSQFGTRSTLLTACIRYPTSSKLAFTAISQSTKWKTKAIVSQCWRVIVFRAVVTDEQARIAAYSLMHFEARKVLL